jgi:polysaccharide biosynthesis protein PslG
MTRANRRSRRGWLAWVLLAGLFALLLVGFKSEIGAALFDLTGEEKLFAQLKGLTDLSADLLRPRLDLAADAPVKHTDVSPFGVNVFLNEEVEPAKREQTVKLASEAGFHFLRQEFPWQDIEIHGKGDFEDRRNEPARPAWDKYDQIVDLAEKYGMELIVRISTPPAWSRKDGDAAGTFAPPDNYDDFGDFVHTLVSRYKGRIKYYQIWNEPNIYPEWGNYAISPEDYTRLFKIGATRAREADPDAVIISGALASTIALQPGAAPPNNALNDLIFLERMYAAGAAPYFDIMAMQGYGLWSGPTDRRMNPRVMNFGRPQFVRDIMVAHGDANKPIWLSEMGWNAVPDEVADKRFGQVTLEQQARYTPLAYQRAREEWPWLGVINTWYFKRATDEWQQQGRPEAYFRLADPDFTLQPVYEGLKQYMSKAKPALYPGTHAANGWAVDTTGAWQAQKSAALPFGQVWTSAEPGATLSFDFQGAELALQAACVAQPCDGRLRVTVDGGAPVEITAGQAAGPVRVARGLGGGMHRAVVEVADAPAGLAAIRIYGKTVAWLPWAAGVIAAAVLLLIIAALLGRWLAASKQDIPQAAGWHDSSRETDG